MDGTREFVMKVPEFVVSVALVEKGLVVLGVIYNPCTGELFESVYRQGTKLNGKMVYCDKKLDGKPKVEVSRSDIEKGRFAGYESCMDLHPCGSIAYKLARLAAGEANGTLSITPKNEWDIAGGVILVTEAGGRVTDLSGDKYQFNQANTLVNGVIATSADAFGVIKNLIDERKKG
jgi:myo-inositol-1(or 4)-monophosphatase